MCPVVWREAAESKHVLMRLTPVLSRPWLLQKAAGRTRLPAKVIDSRERGGVVGKLGKPLASAQSSIPPFEVCC